MDDLLQTIWGHLDRGSFVLSPSEIARFSEADLAALTTAGWLGDAPDSNSIVCEHCNDVHMVEVVARRRARGMRAVVYCPEAGLIAAPAEKRRQMAIRPDGVVCSISAGLGGDASSRCIQPDRNWELGMHQFGELVRPTYLVCGLGRYPSEQPAIVPNAVVFVPGAAPIDPGWSPAPIRVISLLGVTEWENGRLAVNRGTIGRMVDRGAAWQEQTNEDRTGVISTSHVRWEFTDHTLRRSLPTKAENFLRLAIARESVPLSEFVHKGANAIWKWTNDGSHRRTVAAYLSALNKRLADSDPPVPLRFSVVRDEDLVKRHIVAPE